MENFEKCTVAMLGGPYLQHVTGNTSRLNQPQSAIILNRARHDRGCHHYPDGLVFSIFYWGLVSACPVSLSIEVIQLSLATRPHGDVTLKCKFTGVPSNYVKFYWWLRHETNTPIYTFSVREVSPVTFTITWPSHEKVRNDKMISVCTGIFLCFGDCVIWYETFY